MNQRQLESSIFSLHDDTGQIVGSGFCVSERQLLTCSDSVLLALNLEYKPETYVGQYVMLEFPMVAPGKKLAAHVVVWNTAEKFVGLELLEAPPVGVEAAWLMETMDLTDHRVSAYGFALDEEMGKGWSSGLTQSREENGRF